MPPSIKAFPILAFCTGLLVSGSAMALSQIVDDDGNATGELRDGIVAVPLPPLPGTKVSGEGAPAAEEGETAAPDGPQQDRPVAEPAPPAGTPPVVPAAEEATPRSGPAGNQSGGPVEKPGAEPEATPSGSGTSPSSAAGRPAAEAEALPSSQVSYDIGSLPRPVRDLRAKLISIARAGEIEKLKPYLETGPEETVLSFGGSVEDPIEYLKQSSGDGDGIEMLAILLELLEAGHVALEPDSEDAIYVWPYFAQARLDTLTNAQKVELFEIVTAGDYQNMLDFGAYNFYRLGITPEGKLAFFVAGD
ncbi:hypothetical protein [Fulvimarina sp. MAC3]|uniref:hypothetical protein n=1 Tax=Fulvimarina sp. MAC3 TaxID=3148887 RepID=UPI0031FD6765